MQWDCDILILFKICKAICKMMYYVKELQNIDLER